MVVSSFDERIIPIKPSTLDREINRAKAYREKAYPATEPAYAERVSSVFELWSKYPMRFFFFEIHNRVYCGQKLLSPLVMTHGAPQLFCSQITVEMILGEFLRPQTSEEGVEIFYKDISPQKRHALFADLLANRMIDIYFPFTRLKGSESQEETSPKKGWKVNDHQAKLLGLGEMGQRKVSQELILSEGLPAPIIYDPACSTGEFLFSIKEKIPHATVIGQDLSESMCHRAAALLDKVYHADAMIPGVAKDSCDYIFFRFLNVDVVTTQEAKRLFEAIMPCLKKTGKAILFGFTPVLISVPYLQEKGFVIQGCNAALPEQKALIQYYVIQYENPCPFIGPLL